MKFKKIAIIGLSIALLGSLGTFAACQVADQEQPGKEPPEYTFQDGRPDGDLAEPDAGFTIDGVLNEEEYGSIQWLEGAVLRPYATNDGQGVYYDYDLIQQKTEESAHVKMGSYYGEKGVYILYSYKEQEGKVCYVNPNRRSYRNSGVELHIGVPSSRTMTGDETISRITVNANGALTVAKTQGDIWMAPFGTEDSKNMPYVGLTGNGTRTDENADRTEFTFELFIPWGYFDEAAGEGTAQSMKDGGDLVVAPGIITANNYTGNGQTDREYYVISARLDNGEWSNAQGWYHFNEGGAVGYDITVKQAEHGSVQEWMGYGVAAKNSSLTFVTKADEGYALKEFRVNGVAVSGDQISYDMYTTLGAEAESDVQKAYVKIPQKAITGDIEVEAEFAPLAEGEQTLQATVYGISTDTPLKNAELTFTRGDTVIEATTGEDGSVTVEGLTAGLYDVAVNDIAYKTLENWVFYSAEANTQIVFGRNAILLEGRQNVNRTYTTIYNKVTSLADGFVLSGFFGFEGASWDELLAKTFTATLNFNFADGSTYGFRFTIWNPYGPMLKCQGREWNFNDNTAAMEYAEQEGGVYFMIAGDPNGSADEGISVFIKEDADTWVQIARTGGSGDYAFPFDQNLTGISFGKQDSESTDQTAVLEGGELKLGTARVDIPVTVTVNGGETITGGEVNVTQNATLGGSVTVTVMPEANYKLSSLQVDGKAVSCEESEGTYTYTFTAEKSSHAVTVTLGKMADLALNITTSGITLDEEDSLAVTLANAAGDEIELTANGENAWKATAVPYGTYTATVTSVLGGYTVLTQEMEFGEGQESFTLTVTAKNYGAQREYALAGEVARGDDGSKILLENLGTTNSFVFTGFLGMGKAEDGTQTEIAYNLRFSSEVRLYFKTADGSEDMLTMEFITWSNGSQQIKVTYGGYVEFKVTQKCAPGVYERMCEERGVHFAIVMENDVFRVYAQAADDSWVQLHIGDGDCATAATSWDSNADFANKTIQTVKLQSSQGTLREGDAITHTLTEPAVLQNGLFRFGTTDTGIAVTVNGAGSVAGGTVEVTESVTLGGEITVTLTPAAEYAFASLSVDGTPVSCTPGEKGVYTYTFTASKSSHTLAAVFEKTGGAYTVNATVAETLTGAAEDLKVVLTNDSVDNEATKSGDGNAWVTGSLPYGEYTLLITSISGGYTVLEQEVSFTEESNSVTVTVNADNYGKNRVYALNGEDEAARDVGTVIAENLGAAEGGFVLQGFLGVKEANFVANIGNANYVTALRFTTENGYRFRLCFYIWQGKYWVVKAFEEGKENSGATYAHEFAFTDNAAMIEYVKEKNGITVSIAAATDGTLTVYAMANDTGWVLLGEWKSPFKTGEAIEKVEVLKMHNDTQTATVDGELRFGTTDTGIAVTVNGAGSVAGGTVEVTESVTLGGEITVTLTPAAEYAFASLSVDGTPVSCTPGEKGVYTYTFTASKSSHTLAAVFEKTGGAYTVNATVAETLTGAAEDLKVVLTNDSVDNEATKSGDGNAWVTGSLPYGDYTLLITSVSGGYTVLEQKVSFTEESNSVTVTIDADNYGKNRVYALNGAHALPTETNSESGTIVIAEKLGAAEEGFVFQGFLGVQSGSLSSVTNHDYAAVLIFTTESGFRFRYSLYIWAGSTWCIKCYDESNENGDKLELGFNANTTLLNYVKQEGGVHVAIAATTDSKLTVYIRVSDTEWIKLGEGQTKFQLSGKIVKVELLRKFDNELAVSFGAKVEGTLRFGTTATDIPATVTVNSGEEVTGGEVEVTQNATIGGSVTVTLTPEEGYALSSLQVDGAAVSCEESEGRYTYTFTASKSNHELTVVFGALAELTVTVDTSAVSAATDDISVTLKNAAGESVEITQGTAGTWTTGYIPYGTYTATVSSVSGGYTVLTQQVEFSEEQTTLALTVSADNYGETRKYTLVGENNEEYSGGVLAENIGSTDSFVFEGTLGVIEGSASLSELIAANNGSFGTGLRFIMSDGNSFRIAFVANNGTWSIRCYWQTSTNAEKDNQTFTMSESAKTYVSENNGVHIIAVAEKVGDASSIAIYIEEAEGKWVLLGTYTNSNIPLGKTIAQVMVAKMWINDNPDRTPYVNGTLRFGTTDTGLPAVNVLTETINLDEKGTKYWEHYSAGEGEGETHENKPLATRSSEGGDRIALSFPTGFTGDGTTRGSAIDNYETRPDEADNKQAFTSNNGLNSKGFVFRSGANPIEATITLSKGDTAVKVYTGTWISNCQFTISLTDAEGNVVESIGFTVTNGSATYETVFSIDTSDWAEEESKTFTLTCGSNNTLKLMAIAIS